MIILPSCGGFLKCEYPPNHPLLIIFSNQSIHFGSFPILRTPPLSLVYPLLLLVIIPYYKPLLMATTPMFLTTLLGLQASDPEALVELLIQKLKLTGCSDGAWVTIVKDGEGLMMVHHDGSCLMIMIVN